MEEEPLHGGAQIIEEQPSHAGPTIMDEQLLHGAKPSWRNDE
jgi:hypothetical protein